METRRGSATVTLPSDTEILISREFDAPRELVWQALTSPSHLLRWWGPHSCPLVTCEIDLQVGGLWRYVCKDVVGNTLVWRGIYREVVAPERIVSTEVFEGFPDAESINTMTLQQVGLTTRLQTIVRHQYQEFRDGHVQSGMEAGMQETFNRLDDLLVNVDTTAERFRRIAAGFTERAAAVSGDGWLRAAPCEGWIARDIVRHLVEWVPAVIGQSGLIFASETSVDVDPVGAWTLLADTLQAALDDPTVAAREFDAGPPGSVTVEFAIGMMVLGDVLIHTWDLARATGQDEYIDTAIASEMLVGMQPIDDMLRASGQYGPKVAVPADADDQTKLIAFTGRNPFGPTHASANR